jgi:hypothetical protein
VHVGEPPVCRNLAALAGVLLACSRPLARVSWMLMIADCFTVWTGPERAPDLGACHCQAHAPGISQSQQRQTAPAM